MFIIHFIQPCLGKEPINLQNQSLPTDRLHATSASQHLLIFACEKDEVAHWNSNQYSILSANLKSSALLTQINQQIKLNNTE